MSIGTKLLPERPIFLRSLSITKATRAIYLAIIDKKGKIVLNRLEKAVGIQMRTPGLDGREAYRLAKEELDNEK